MEKTYYPKGTVEANWLLVDASGQTLGRLASQIASYLIGKHKPTYTPGVEGDYVIVINTKHLAFTGKRLVEKMYYRHSGYPGGLTATNLQEMMNTYPDRVIRLAVWGMLPHNKYGRKLLKRLKIYPESDHPHVAQNPQSVA